MGFPDDAPVEVDVASIFQLRDGMIADYQVIAAAKTASEPNQTVGISNIVHES